MRTVLQRVSCAEVRLAGSGEVLARIGRGVVLLVAVEKGDGEVDVETTARKVAALRIFPGRTPMDLALAEARGSCLVVSQFTLAASLCKGNRPGFDAAAEPGRAEALYLLLARRLAEAGLPVATGRFGALMEVDLVNDGPVTLWLEVRQGRLA